MEDSKTRHVTQEVRVAQIVSGTIRYTINSFIIDRRGRNLSKETIGFYERELEFFAQFLDQQGVETLAALTPDDVRRWLIQLSERRNGGGLHASYRAIRALLIWAWDEFEIETRNPIKKVTAPKRNLQARPGVPLDNVGKMIEVCRGDKLADRDKAILYLLVDTGIRVGEMRKLDIRDVDLQQGVVTIHHGKGDRRRTVYIVQKTRRALRRYLASRPDAYDSEPLFVSDEGGRLAISGIRHLVQKRAEHAGVDAPALHDFRRCFAVNNLIAGMDLLMVSRLLGHSDVSTTQRYLALLSDDLQKAHSRISVVDKLP